MATHAERRALPYTPAQMYALVADVERYPEFLPWCRAARITRRDGDVLYAHLVIGFQMFRERLRRIPRKARAVPQVRNDGNGNGVRNGVRLINER